MFNHADWHYGRQDISILQASFFRGWRIRIVRSVYAWLAGRCSLLWMVLGYLYIVIFNIKQVLLHKMTYHTKSFFPSEHSLLVISVLVYYYYSMFSIMIIIKMCNSKYVIRVLQSFRAVNVCTRLTESHSRKQKKTLLIFNWFTKIGLL